MSRPARLRRWAAALAGVAALTLATLWVLAAPRRSALVLPAREPDVAAGEVLYHAGSCYACHEPPEGTPADVAGLPAGGAAFETPVGTFFPQNLTPDAETGLGRWTAEEFVTAMTQGISPQDGHYFPAFPYTSYRWMRSEDLLDLFGYLKGLPAVRSPARAPELFASGVARRGVGLWKRLAFAEPGPLAAAGDALARGAYLVGAPGHCGECHTPRNVLMIPDASRSLAGGPHPRGEGSVPSLRGLVARGRYDDAADLAFALRYGETLGYDRLSSGGMGDIQANLAQLPESDTTAIAAYLVNLE